MKKSLYFVLAMLLAVSGYAIWNSNEDQPAEEPGKVEVVGMEFSKDLILKEMEYDKTKDILSYELVNNTGKILDYGLAFDLLKLQEDKTLKETGLIDDMAFIEILLSVEPGKNVNDEILFELIDKTIEPGRYYVIRKYTDREGNVHIPEVSFEVTENSILPVK